MDRDILELAVELRHTLHAHPEVSGKERWTKACLMDYLRKHAPHLTVVDRGQWFYAKYTAGEGRPSVAFRTELDALPIEDRIDKPYVSTIPGVGHKCGHDGHMAALTALALEIDRRGAEQNVYFLYQHAEETGEGAPVCCALLREEPIERIYAWHHRPGEPMGTVLLREGTLYCASRGMILSFSGVASHAAYPENGRNPAFAMADILHALPQLAQVPDRRGLTMATVIQVTAGEPTFGTQAHEGKLLLTIRAAVQDDLERLQAILEDFARKKAEEYGLTAAFSYCDDFPVTDCDPREVDKLRRICANKGIPVKELAEPYRGSEDFGHYTRLVRGAYFEVGSGEECCPYHTVGLDFPDACLPTAVDVMLGLLQEKTDNA